MIFYLVRRAGRGRYRRAGSRRNFWLTTAVLAAIWLLAAAAWGIVAVCVAGAVLGAALGLAGGTWSGRRAQRRADR